MMQKPGPNARVCLDHLDHVVLTVSDIRKTCDFYVAALGMEVTTFGHNRVALKFGAQKINLHVQDSNYGPRAHRPTPGSADLCFITSTPIHDVIAHLFVLNIPIEEGPIARTGARAQLSSIYLRDPDLNLLEIANEVSEGAIETLDDA